MKKVEISGVNTAKLKVLPEKEQRKLLEEAKNGNKFSREKLVNANLKLVLSIIQRFSLRGENPDDLFQIGCLGLIKSIDNFDLNQPVKFSTYAVPMVIGEIRRYLRDNTSIRVSRSLRDIAYKALRTKEELSKISVNEPTIEEIAKQIGEERESVVLALESIQDPMSLYEPIYNEGEDAIFLLDQLSDEQEIDDKWIMNIGLKESIKKLKNREKQIIDLRFFKGKTQMEVAIEVGISQAQVSRIEKTALSKLKKNIS